MLLKLDTNLGSVLPLNRHRVMLPRLFRTDVINVADTNLGRVQLILMFTRMRNSIRLRLFASVVRHTLP